MTGPGLDNYQKKFDQAQTDDLDGGWHDVPESDFNDDITSVGGLTSQMLTPAS